jgi:hypothetical protein
MTLTLRLQKPQGTKRAASDASSGSEDSEDDSEEDDDDDNDDDDPTAALIKQSRKEALEKARADRRAKKQAAQAESHRLAETRRKKEIKLNRISSISSAGGGGGRGPLSSGRPSDSPGAGKGKGGCFVCGEVGHMKADCPKKSKRR